MLQDRTFFGSSPTSPPGTSYSFGPLSTFPPPTNSHLSQNQTTDRSFEVGPPHLTASNSDPAVFMADSRSSHTILIRKLPPKTSIDAVNGMLLFSGELVGTAIVSSPYNEDISYTTAIARFQTSAGAHEAQSKLQGKSVANRDAAMIVEYQHPSIFERRATIDGIVPRQESGSTSSASSHGGPPPARSRFNSTFQSSDKISPPLPTPSVVGNGNEFPISDPNRIQNLFSATSPVSNGVHDRNRISGKSVINNDDADDETGELLRDPLAYAKSGQQARRSSQAQVPVSHFRALSLSTGTNGQHNNLMRTTSHQSTPRGAPALQPPHSPTNITNMSTGNAYSMNQARQNNYPPINPADQNPPCNTLYVGNLPIDTSEDELKTIFCKARGYKRLCFRTKQNGPMCFVEFEDTSYATVALKELYGYPLHNSVKGGIRLSYSKNPLGVRSGQTNGMNLNGGYSHHPGFGASGYVNNMNGVSNASNFTAVSGPPPGIISPPGFNHTNGSTNYMRQPTREAQPSAFERTAFNNPFGPPGQEFSDTMSQASFSGGVPPNMSGKYGRDSRGSFSGFMSGR